MSFENSIKTHPFATCLDYLGSGTHHIIRKGN